MPKQLMFAARSKRKTVEKVNLRDETIDAARADVAVVQELGADFWQHPDLAGLPVHNGRMPVDLCAAEQ